MSHGFLLPEIPLTEAGGTQHLLLEQIPTNTSTLLTLMCNESTPFFDMIVNGNGFSSLA